MKPSLRMRLSRWCWFGGILGAMAMGIGSVALLGLPDPLPPSVPDPQPELPARPASEIRLARVTGAALAAFQHHDGGSAGKKYLIEAVSAGLALFDYDRDGRLDVYFLNGAPLLPAPPDPSRVNGLFRNEGAFHFSNITAASGVGDPGFGLGVAVGDFDNDGFLDVYVNNFGPNALYRNNGDGTFAEVTAHAGVACGNQVGAGACFLDADGDGDLDLYVGNYVRFGYDNHVPRTIDGHPCYPGPLDFEPAPDVLYRNEGDGTFRDVSDEAGISAVAGTSMGMVCADIDNDGDTDVFVVNDQMANFLFENDGSGRFQEVGMLQGLAYDLAGEPQGNMGVDCGDYDNDGWLDFFTTSYSHQMPALYRNRGRGLFADVTLAAGAGGSSRPHVNWGTGFADFDNDGNRDLFVACGHLDQEVHRWNTNTAFKVRNVVLQNAGGGRFVDVSDVCGEGLEPVESSRGIGLDDLDNDGKLDVVILNSGASPTVLRNESENDRHWIQIQLAGTRANRDGVGAQVRVTAGGVTQLAEVHSGRGYQSHHGTRLHFGLGASHSVDRIEIRWIGGGSDAIENLAADQLVHIIEGEQAAKSLPCIAGAEAP